ncbi:amidohydrolase [Blautia obeum]|nr:amidohydrolase [Blautia obeum]
MSFMIDETGQRILRLIDVHKDQIIAFAEDIAAHPEPGYEEFCTAGKTAEVLKNLGYKVTEHLARTGVKGTKSIKEGPSLTVIGELDAIGCHSHPNANPVTGVAHACGHHAQMAAMIGCAIAMADPDVQKCLAGTVNFLAVPAEEYIDADKRARLKKEGIEFCCGKSEMIRTGVFDDTDIALTTHVHMVPVEEDFYLGNPACNGYSAERVTVRGKAAHGAIDPWNGVNALSITTSAIQMMGLMRETFREEDHVRLHNVIRKAGDVINSVPDEAIVETKVRAASLDKICEITDMVNRAYAGSAYAFGGKIEMEKLQGYMPIIPRAADNALIEAADDLGLNYRTVQKGDFNNACTDVGDLSHLVPVVNFTFKGFEGKLHGADFKITDPEKAYILPVKLLALTVYKLLKNGGQEAKKITKSYTPVFNKESYIQYVKNTIE